MAISNMNENTVYKLIQEFRNRYRMEPRAVEMSSDTRQAVNAGENALVLFLQVLSELKDSGDACKRELVRLADDLVKELQQQ